MELRPHVVRYENGKAVRGRACLVCLNHGSYVIAPMYVWADGAIDCGERMDLDGLRRLIREGRIVTELPEGAQVSIEGLSAFKVTEVKSVMAGSELVLQVQDMLDQLNHRPDSAQRCRDSWRRFQVEPNETRRHDLRAAYLAVPEHQRRTMLETEPDDTPILEAIAGLEVEGDVKQAVAMHSDMLVQKTLDFILSSVTSRQSDLIHIAPKADSVHLRFEREGVVNNQTYKREIHTGMTVRLGHLVKEEVYPLRHPVRSAMLRDGVSLQVSFHPTVHGAEIFINRAEPR